MKCRRLEGFAGERVFKHADAIDVQMIHVSECKARIDLLLFQHDASYPLQMLFGLPDLTLLGDELNLAVASRF